ncbi:MAG: HD-GYP domain-containing protein [Clostridiales bacterium]|jgi:putative nucleotidyltransferase with HDIG domain|nr:HD-GYP domain-containing protein [Clostridiales bacterium]
MRVAETIVNDFNAVIIHENTVLDRHIIDKLILLKEFEKIKIYDDPDIRIENNTVEAVQKDYEENRGKMKEVMHDIVTGKSVDMSVINDVSDSMLKRGDNALGVLSCLNQIRVADEYLYSHSLNVSIICMLTAKWLNYSEEAVRDILQAGLLHDIGKCRIPAEILNKPARLTSEEFAEMKKHPYYGYKILEKTPDVKETTKLAALSHHEKENGGGYPFGVKSERIHPFGKICAVADIYDAMTSNRVYHQKISPFEVFSLLENEEFGSLDPSIILTFVKNLAGYYIGDRVRLSNGDMGVVAYINPLAVPRPIIRTDSQQTIDLNEPENKELTILELC